MLSNSLLALDAANRIRKIVAAAKKRRMPIKWFDINKLPSTPPTSPLGVVNAEEVSTVRRTKLHLREVINLTIINKDSLVLYSPTDVQAAGVLFCADSGFATIPNLTLRPRNDRNRSAPWFDG